MAEQYVMMPQSDYIDACDSIRIKTDTSAAIKSGQLKALIDSIEHCMVEGVGLNNDDELIITATDDVTVYEYNENLIIQIGEDDADIITDVSTEGV